MNRIPYPVVRRLLLFSAIVLGLASMGHGLRAEEVVVTPYEGNAWYWQIDGEPTVLLGANETDHTFLMKGRAAYLDQLQAMGGNFVRNVMSQREPEAANRPHRQLPNGKYDLDHWNPAYWENLQAFLMECESRKLVVAVELWDKFDYQKNYWEASAWRPRNNVNYTLAESGLNDLYEPTLRSDEKNELHLDNPFLATLPEFDDNQLILGYQHAFFDKVLSVTLQFSNVIYYIGNEWKESQEWPIYWANRLKHHTAEAGKEVPLSVMVWSSSEAFDPELNFVLDRSDLFSFAGFRVGNPKIPLGPGHYERIMEVRSMVDAAGPRPMVDSKIRTGSKLFYHPVRQARVWRGFMAGWSALSHHRVHVHPTRGTSQDMGFTPAAQANLRAMRRFSELITPWECEPRPDLLDVAGEDEGYLMADPGRAYGVYFVLQGSAELPLPSDDAVYQLTWINIETGEALDVGDPVAGGQTITLEAPAQGSEVGWAATLVRTN